MEAPAVDTIASCSDEQAHRAVLADLRLMLDEELSNIELGHIPKDSKRARLVKLLARAYDLYSGLFMQTVMEEIGDAVARQANKRFKTENAFLRKEVDYYRGVLNQERATTTAYFDLSLKYSLKTQQEGGTPL